MNKNYMFIRGARIAKQLEEFLAEESTFAELERNALNMMPGKSRKDAINSIQIRTLELIPYEGALGVNSTVNSINSGNTYQPQIMFLGVNYINTENNPDAENDPNTITFQAVDGKDYTIEPIYLSRNNAKVRCTCLDFKWRFAIYNEKDHSLYGSGPGMYRKKTERPPNNPQHVPGVCKHLLKLASELQINGIVRP